MRHDVNHIVDVFLTSVGCENTSIVVGVSGGVDSIVLLNVLASLAESKRLALIVTHVNYGLRGADSDADEAFVQSKSTELGLPFFVRNANAAEENQMTGKGIEATARSIRYNFFVEVAKKCNASVVAVGHNADDVAETFIMHAARGSGIDGITAHRAIRELDSKIVLIRPMLAVLRSSVLEFARQNNLTWREDSSNNELHYLRNKIRHKVIPELKQIFGTEVTSRIATSAQLLNDARSIVQQTVTDEYLNTVDVESGICSIALNKFETLSIPLRFEVVRTALRKTFGKPPSMTDAQRVVELLECEVGSVATLAGRLIATRERNRIVLQNANPEPAFAEVCINADGMYVAGSHQLHVQTQMASEVIIDHHPASAMMDASVLHGQLVWRKWHHRDRMIPFGSTNSVLVSDLLTNAKVDHSKRTEMRVVEDDDGILWLCGIRQSERTRITANTKTVLTLRQLTVE